MQSIGQALETAITNMTHSHSEHVCPHCEKVVPKVTINLLGQEKQVQPRCQCEIEQYEREISEHVELQRKHEIERKFSMSELGERFNDCTFDTFKARQGSDRVERLAQEYASFFPQQGGESLLIWGEPGNGKTHLAAAICHTLKARGYVSVFQSVPELLERIKGTFNRSSRESEKEIMDALRDCDLLVLDDIGAEKISDWVLDVMFRIIDGRYRQKKPTLLTTNFSPMELLNRFMPAKPSVEQEMSAKRIHDRIIEMNVIVENSSSSYRMEVARERARKRAME